MKLARIGQPGHERPALLLPDGRLVDASTFTPEYDEAFFGDDALPALASWAAQLPADCTQLGPGQRFGPPVARPSKLICVGLNYADHASETGAPIPVEPILFSKATSAITGPNDDLIIPRGSHKTDWEVELAVVISRRASYVSEDQAHRHIAGYLLHNDYSEREWQFERGGQHIKGKSCDTFATLGPYLVTPDEIPDPQDLRLWLKVNGTTRQDSSTAQMIFPVKTLISYISQFMTLLPGDIISTGTPPGVGVGHRPHPVFLRPGDQVEFGIDGLGTARQTAVAAP
jgi:2,4-didehydro-3-deoxy-L-rhamnonate hydrolase